MDYICTIYNLGLSFTSTSYPQTLKTTTLMPPNFIWIGEINLLCDYPSSTAYPLEGHGGTGANPSWHWAKSGVHPGQVPHTSFCIKMLFIRIVFRCIILIPHNQSWTDLDLATSVIGRNSELAGGVQLIPTKDSSCIPSWKFPLVIVIL